MPALRVMARRGLMALSTRRARTNWILPATAWRLRVRTLVATMVASTALGRCLRYWRGVKAVILTSISIPKSAVNPTSDHCRILPKSDSEGSVGRSSVIIAQLAIITANMNSSRAREVARA